MDRALSLLFSVVTVYALGVAGITAFSWRNVAAATLFLFAVTDVAVLR